MIKNLRILGLALLSLVACNDSSNTHDTNSNEVTTEKTVVEKAANHDEALPYWVGEYEGVVPCADCPGIKYEVELYENSTYSFTETYLESEDSSRTYTGSMIWYDNNSIVSIGEEEGEKYFSVEDGRLVMLDRDRNKLKGDLADKYVLLKEE